MTTYIHKLPTAWIQPSDVSDVVLFLVSDEARWVTGTGLDVSAGVSTQYSA
jgi:NAD(P)-dependent dehydrogenase (short-subunit alcohol dehydrogenase family)